MLKIAVYTQSYNAVNTIERTIQSVLQQEVNGDFLYYIADNNSTDGTQQIIADYAKRDKRIIPFFFDENLMLRGVTFMQNMAREGKAEYIAMLDADDEYVPGAFQDLADFADEHGLDVASGGHVGVDGVSGNFIENPPGVKNFLEDRVINNKSDFMNTPFWEYSRFTMVWAKLFRSTTLAEVDLNTNYHKSIRWGWDGVFTLSMYLHCMNIGFRKGVHLNYWQMNNSFMKTFNKENIISVRLYDDFLNYYVLRVHAELNDRDKQYLSLMHLSNVDKMLFHISNLSSHEEKLKALKLLLNNVHTKNYFKVWKLYLHDLKESIEALENLLHWLKGTNVTTTEMETTDALNKYLNVSIFPK